MTYRRSLRTPLLAALLACLLAGLASAQTPVTSVTIADKAGVTTANYPMMLSIIFKQGDVADHVTAKIGAQSLTTQTDVKVRWPDNSVRHALVSFVIPTMPANGSVTVDLIDGGTNANSTYLTKAQLLATDFDARMAITPAGEGTTTITARNLLNGISDPEYWIKGDVCTEFLIRDFSQNIDNQLNVQFYVRYFPGWDGFRVDSVVENCWCEYRGNVTYDFDLQLGNSNPQSVFSKTDFTHNVCARWHKVFWQGDTPPEVEIRYDIHYLISTGMLPNYDTTLVVPEQTINNTYSGWLASAHDLMEPGLTRTEYPDTGGYADRPIYSMASVRYLLTMDNRQKAIVLAAGDTSGYTPVHFRESDPNRTFFNHIMSVDDRPTLWTERLDYIYTDPADRLPSPIGPTNTIWHVDEPHQPSFAYIPYMITGDYYYLEEMYFVVSWDIPDSNPKYRNYADGWIISECRGVAWVMRNLVDAAIMAPDADTLEKNYFNDKIQNTIDRWHNVYLNGDFPTTHHFVGQDIRTSEFEDRCKKYFSPWQDDFMMIVMAHMRDMGYDTQSVMDWVGDTLVNRFHNPDLNWYRGAPYHMAAMYDDGTGVLHKYATWPEVNAAWVSQPGPDHFNPIGDDDYPIIARAAMSYVLNLPNGQDVWNWYDGILPGKNVLNASPGWAIVPPNYVPPADVTPPAAPTDLEVIDVTYSSATVRWTAPGDDGNTGTATSYDLRYSTDPITTANWWSATPATGEPTPALAGTTQSMVVTGLNDNTTYYFAMKASDEVPHTSDLSENTSGTTPLEPDLTAPAAVSNLATSNATTSSITLTWTAPGDDGTTGTANNYDIRYSTQMIDNDNWDSATQIAGEPAPSVAGTSESMTVSGLADGTTYYFAMKTSDEVPNTSGLSNVVTRTTVAIPPVVQFAASSASGSEGTTPASITVTLDKTWDQTVVINYAITGGTAVEGTDFTVPQTGGNVVMALKRDATLVAGGALSSQFGLLTDNDVVQATVKDAVMVPDQNSRYKNYGTTSQAQGSYIVIGFNLSAYTGATVNKAELRLRSGSGNTAMQWAGIKSHDWAEGKKANDYPGADPAAEGVCWAHPNGLYTAATGALGWGANSDSMFSATSDGDDIYALTNFTSTPGGAAWVVANVTSIVQDWLNSSKPDYGLFISDGNNTPYLSEYSAAYQPVLFLDADLPNQQLRFAPGETSKTIDLTIIDDTAMEPSETIELTLSSPVNATLGSQATFTYTIVDNDNQTPTVDAGTDQTITLPASANLSGTASDDGLPNPPGALTYTWSQVSGPGTVTFGDTSALATTATFSVDGTYVLQLQASDSVLSATDTVTITVNPVPNEAPMVDAGSDQTITLPTDTVTLAGTASDDGLPNPPASVTTTWSKVSGPGTVTFADANATGTTATVSTDGTYVLQLQASDGALSSTDTVTITVNPPITVQFSTTSASGDEGTTSVNLTVSLSAASSLPVTVDYAATGGTATEGSDFTLPATGNKLVALKRDATLTQGGAIASQFTTLGDTDVVQATVKDAVMVPDQTSRYRNYGTRLQANGGYIVVGFDLAAYDGSVVNKAELRLRSGNGNTAMQWAGIKSHDWAEGNKNGDFPGLDQALEGVCWAHPNGLYTSATGALGWGANSDSMFSTTSDGDDIYALTNFTSTPGGATWVVADVTSIVQDWLNSSKPNYGLFITDGNNTPYLSEYGADYQPVLFLNLTLPDRSVTFAPGETSKTIPLTIVDDTLAELSETIEITLSNPTNASLGTNTTCTYTILDNDNQPPTVDAGTDQSITLPDSASLSGIADDDGLPNPPGALTYTWSQVSGPGTTTFADANAINTTATFSTDGTYVLQLLADDGALTTSDTVTITVDPAPTVQFDQTTSSGSEGTTSVSLTVSLSSALSEPVTVDYAVSGGTASIGSDFALSGLSNEVVALKRDATLTQGGAIASQFGEAG